MVARLLVIWGSFIKEKLFQKELLKVVSWDLKKLLIIRGITSLKKKRN